MLHCVYFDGSSYFVDGADFVCDEDTKMVKTFADLDAAEEFCEHENENLYS